jgi:hypothetical protein
MQEMGGNIYIYIYIYIVFDRNLGKVSRIGLGKTEFKGE